MAIRIWCLISNIPWPFVLLNISYTERPNDQFSATYKYQANESRWWHCVCSFWHGKFSNLLPQRECYKLRAECCGCGCICVNVCVFFFEWLMKKHFSPHKIGSNSRRFMKRIDKLDLPINIYLEICIHDERKQRHFSIAIHFQISIHV